VATVSARNFDHVPLDQDTISVMKACRGPYGGTLFSSLGPNKDYDFKG